MKIETCGLFSIRYLDAISVSSYSMVSMVQHFGPIMNTSGAFLSLSYLASQRVVPQYGGGMSSAKAALESDTKVLAFEAGRKWGLRINTVSAGPLRYGCLVTYQLLQACLLLLPLVSKHVICRCIMH